MEIEKRDKIKEPWRQEVSFRTASKFIGFFVAAAFFRSAASKLISIGLRIVSMGSVNIWCLPKPESSREIEIHG